MDLSKNVLDALKIIEKEYNAQKNSCDSYVFLDKVKNELQAIRQRKIDGFIFEEVNKEDTKVLDYTVGLIRDASGTDVETLKSMLHLTSAEIINSIQFDELDWIELIMDLEEHFNIEVPLHFEDNITTLNSLIEFVKSKI